MALNEKERVLLVELLSKIESTEIKGDIWHELVKKFVTVSIELCVIDDKNRILLIRRLANDRELKGRPYHIPGTVLNDWETVEEARKRLIETEIVTVGMLGVTKPKSIGWFEISKKQTYFTTRHAVALLHVAYFHGEYSNTEEVGFFYIDSIPDNTVEVHKSLIDIFKNYLKDSYPVFSNIEIDTII
ncbi:MAG: hypothetical protein WC827_02165 [Candidatus Paceibacterota bacterium]|jgi:ADP-ribose pyrophosphatase YjhB (NUDIX family)